MRVIPTTEDIQDAKGYQPTYKEIALNEVRKLRHITGNRKLWGEVMPTGRVVMRADGSGEWVEWLDFPQKEIETELAMTREYLARKKGWIESACHMKMPGGWMLSEAFEQVPGYSPDYFGNPITPMSSPHKMRKWGWAVWRRAKQILKPYGWSPSRKALEAALISHAYGQVGKIAIRIAAASLPVMFGGGLMYDATRGHNRRSALRSIKEARVTLIRARGWGQMQKRWAHDPEVVRCVTDMIKHHGYSIPKAEHLVVNTLFSGSPILDKEGMARTPLTGGKLGERVCIYHDPGFPTRGRSTAMERLPWWGVTKIKVYSCTNPVCTDYHTDGGPKAALAAWKKQIKTYNQRITSTRILKELVDRPDGAVTIVFFQTSLESGNCSPGTASWARRMGYKNAAPLSAVMSDGRYEARRVVDFVAQTY